MSSSLNTSMLSSGSSASKKKAKDEANSYLQTWNAFYKEMDEDRFHKTLLAPWFSRASIQISPSLGIDLRFIGIFYCWIERLFLNCQTISITSICQLITPIGQSDERAVLMAKQVLMSLINTLVSTNVSEFSFKRFSAFHEDLHRLIGWSKKGEAEVDHSIAENFTSLALAFYVKKFNESMNAAQRSGVEWNQGSIEQFFEKFDKEKALIVSTWIKMPIKVLIAKPEKIQIYCDKNGGPKESLFKIDKSIILVEDATSAGGAIHIGYDCCAERMFRFMQQAKAIAEEQTISQSAIQQQDLLHMENSSLSRRVASDCSKARVEAESLTTKMASDLTQMKSIFHSMTMSWMKTLGMIKNYIIPAVGMKNDKKNQFLRTLDSQTTILEQVSIAFGAKKELLCEIHEKYLVKHQFEITEAIKPIPKEPATVPENVVLISSNSLQRKAQGLASTNETSTAAKTSLSNKQTLEQLIYGDQEDTSQWTMKKVMDEARLGIRISECAICCESKKSNEFWYAKCQHVYCFDCLKDHISSRVDVGKRQFEDFTCCMCTLVLEPRELFTILPEKVKEQIDNYYANKILNFTCPNEKCALSSFISEKTIALSEGFITNCCGQHVCSKCKGKFHGNTLCPSQTKELIESVSVFREAQTTDAARMFRFCPICAQLAFKDQGCNHVRCTKCSTEFCFQCSAPRESILGHGNHYHRKGCPDFSEYIDKKSKKPVDLEFDIKKCKTCAKVKRACKRPPEWNDFNTYLIGFVGVEVFNTFPDNFIL